MYLLMQLLMFLNLATCDFTRPPVGGQEESPLVPIENTKLTGP